MKLISLLFVFQLLIFPKPFLISQVDTLYYKNGKIEWIGKSINQRRVGFWIKYDSVGKLIKKLEYSKGGRFSAEKIEFRGIDIIKDYFHGYIDKNGKEVLNGKYQTYFNKDIHLAMHYKNGLYSGVYKYYHNGNIQTKCFYKNNLKHGNYIEYFENKQIRTKGKYLNGKKTGKWKLFYQNGNLNSLGIYCSTYYVVQYENFDNFTFKVMDETMNIVKEEYYPSQVIEYLDYIKNEAKSFDLPQLIFLKDKEWKYWNTEGQLIKVEIYDNGKLLETKFL